MLPVGCRWAASATSTTVNASASASRRPLAPERDRRPQDRRMGPIQARPRTRLSVERIRGFSDPDQALASYRAWELAPRWCAYVRTSTNMQVTVLGASPLVAEHVRRRASRSGTQRERRACAGGRLLGGDCPSPVSLAAGRGGQTAASPDERAYRPGTTETLGPGPKPRTSPPELGSARARTRQSTARTLLGRKPRASPSWNACSRISAVVRTCRAKAR